VQPNFTRVQNVLKAHRLTKKCGIQTESKSKNCRSRQVVEPTCPPARPPGRCPPAPGAECSRLSPHSQSRANHRRSGSPERYFTPSLSGSHSVQVTGSKHVLTCAVSSYCGHNPVIPTVAFRSESRLYYDRPRRWLDHSSEAFTILTEPFLAGVCLTILLVLAILRNNRSRLKRNRQIAAWGHDYRRDGTMKIGNGSRLMDCERAIRA
jgi:hypothetical protein